MVKLYLKFIIFSLGIVAFSCSDHTRKSEELSKFNFYSQGNTNRVAAEWEPALGTMIAWPLSVPYKLVIELARDSYLFTLVENETSKNEAIKWYSEWGIDTTKSTFIYAPQGLDAWWVRDWGPHAVFTPDGKMELADGKYIYSTPFTNLPCQDTLDFLYKTADNKIIKTEIDDNATIPLGRGLNLDVLDLPFISTGGNILTDGLGTAFSTCILTNENRFYGVSETQFLKLNAELLGITNYNIISNYEISGIQHIDCYLKLLDEERILVTEPPRDHELYKIYEDIIQNELVKLKTPYGRPYKILRIKSDRYHENKLAAYTNSLILNQTIYVPLFRIKEDSLALLKWEEVMPGYAIKGFEFTLADEPVLSQKMKDHYHTYGWRYGDALHCRARAVWDQEMLFISVKRIDSVVGSKHNNSVYATIIDYSKKGIREERSVVQWRLLGETKWKTTPLHQIKAGNHYYTEIPHHKSGTTVEYFVSATTNSGRRETQPRTAPLGTFKFSIE